ncbi:hypothetical protein Sjap_000144 [Stephania japonica]|uniref:Alpha/beta hydrolase fold-3 domain-containing protein n=1 Tax=Stephania japonica TaxID=461633 RepID=A0AAP0PS69_9MAGN
MTTNNKPYVVEESRGALKVYSDGTISRSIPSAFSPPIIDDPSVLHEQYTFHSLHNLPLRIYKPNTSTTTTTTDHKLPIFIFFHGGGFCIGSCTWPVFHNACIALAAAIQAVVIAPDYRLAPEHRLPAAYEDAIDVLTWVKDRAVAREESGRWWTEVVDFGRVFIGGESAGGNISHHLAVRLRGGGGEKLELGSVKVQGFVMVAPAFGGVERTASEAEAEGAIGSFLSLEQCDRNWKLCSPVGETRDHPFLNPFGPASPSLELVSLEPILVVCGNEDMLRDRDRDYVNRLKNWGKKIEYKEIKGEQHGFMCNNLHSDGWTKLMELIKGIIAKNSD